MKPELGLGFPLVSQGSRVTVLQSVFYESQQYAGHESLEVELFPGDAAA